MPEIRYNGYDFFLFLCLLITVRFEIQPLKVKSTEVVQYIVTDTITTNAEDYNLF